MTTTVPAISRPSRGLPVAALVVALGCLAAACGPREHRLEHFDMVDLPATVMFQQLAAGLDMASVLELPERNEAQPFDLHLEDVTAREVIAELCRREPAFAGERRDAALLMWPASAASSRSALETRIPQFSREAGAGEVVSELMKQAGVPTEVRAQAAIGRRAVKVDVRDASVRDVLALVAAQAHSAIVARPGLISLQPVAQPTDIR